MPSSGGASAGAKPSLEEPDQGLGKVLQGSSSSQLPQFTFVPEEWRLPIKTLVVWKQGGGHLTVQADEYPATLDRTERESITDSMLSDGGLYKAEVVFIADPEVSSSTDRPRKEPLTQPHKIKLSYKALAAIPTNTLLLDQQAVDSVETPAGDGGVEDTHLEMCSPAQLRQQSEELYAVIDKVLEDPLPLRNPSPARWGSGEIMDQRGGKPCASSPRSMGRETKYATRHSHPAPESSMLDYYTTKPGVIKPVNFSPRLMVTNDDEDDDGDGYHGNPFKQYMQELSDSHSKLENSLLRTEAGGARRTEAGGARRTEAGGAPPSLPVLLTPEGERPRPYSPPGEGGGQRSQTPCSPAQLPPCLMETHI